MFKKVVSLLTGVGIGVAAVKLVSKHFGSDTQNSVIPMLYEIRKQRDSGEVMEVQYCETIKALHSIASEKDKKEINTLLEEKYFIAEDMLNTHIELMNEVNNMGTDLLREFIERFPYEAYINGVIGLNEYSFEAKTIPTEEAECILQSYISRMTAEKEEILEDVKMLNGDIEKVEKTLDKIVLE